MGDEKTKGVCKSILAEVLAFMSDVARLSAEVVQLETRGLEVRTKSSGNKYLFVIQQLKLSQMDLANLLKAIEEQQLEDQEGR